jgi:catechol 2,3-dioxygenase-like lactoylglutathione lyase family enzyme
MVTDVDASVRFYTEVLGLSLQTRHGDFWAEVAAPGITVGLHPGLGAPIEPTHADMSIGFVIEDFDATVAGLEAEGIHPRVDGNERARSGYFTDPDGHSLYVMWRAG